MPAFDFRLAALAPALANRALESEAWAKHALAAHAGAQFEVRVGPAIAAFRLDAAGALEPASDDDPRRALTLVISPFALPAFLANPKRWDEIVRAEGDATLAATLKGIAETLPWFVERLLASALGPIVGQRVADAGRNLLALPEHAVTHVGENVASYVKHESHFAVGGRDLQSFGQQVGEIARRADELESRIASLEARR